jgi:DNA processing protein
MPPADPDHLRAWLRLTLTPGVGAGAVRRLLAACGMPEQVFDRDRDALAAIVGPDRARALAGSPPAQIAEQIALTLAWLEEPGNRLVTLADPEYPPQLLNIADPPPLLYVKGDAAMLARPAIAIVGSRNATAQGVADAEAFARALSESGQTVVSGLALGIDAAAHRGGLAGGSGTVAVIGTGADIVYPARNRDLAHRIVQGGAIVSEFPLGTTSIAHNFPRRNRIISGLARGVLVVEAAARSGSLITARMAGEQGREVFAIPGSIHSPVSKGCHMLIRQGAKLVESAQDVLEELGLDAAGGRPPAQAATDDPVLRALGWDPVDADTLASRIGLDAGTTAARLMELELQGRVARLPGGLYQRIANDHG